MSTEAASSTTQKTGSWIKPTTTNLNGKPVLKLYNTITKSKVEFVPRDANEVTWYSCGPTVYNSSHMGHARNYVTIDINRRIIQDYFGYNVKFIQNVTDIDDKIILKARQEYLFKEFSKKFDEITPELLTQATDGFKLYIAKNLPEFEESGSTDFIKWSSEQDLKVIGLSKPKFPMHVKASIVALSAIQSASSMSVSEFLAKTQDVIIPVLDKNLGSTVTDTKIFKACSAFWEEKFDEDMSKLNVLPSTVTTRVSEYVPEIVEFVQKIIDQGYAYKTDDGSVYFNTAKFDNDPNHEYAKCQPSSKGDMALLADGEGSLTSTVEKVNQFDFALWKASKAGEPFWPSPWGKGRPGWHIECSVMASDFVGEGMDIHSGGIDLAFPHHDNELAQSEAHYDCKQWVNYFLHTGHLHIEGQKMSKSLKNFITIEEALESYSSRQLRLAFCLIQWNYNLDFKESLLTEVRNIESRLNSLFKNVRALKSDNEHKLASGLLISKKFGKSEKELFKRLAETKIAVHAAFCDNLSTPVALRSLMDLVSSANNYISEIGSDIRVDPLIQVINYITKILDILGLPARQDKLGWLEESTDANGASSSSKEDIAMPYAKVLSTFRDLVRSSAINKDDYTVLLKACDELRDKELLNLNISLDDRSDGQGALVKFLTDSEKHELIKQQEEKVKLQQEKEQKKLQQKKLAEQKERERLEKGKVNPSQMFLTEEFKKLYIEWDDQGLPTKTIEGEEVAKSAKKKLVKQQNQQAKLHDEYLKKVGSQ